MEVGGRTCTWGGYRHVENCAAFRSIDSLRLVAGLQLVPALGRLPSCRPGAAWRCCSMPSKKGWSDLAAVRPDERRRTTHRSAAATRSTTVWATSKSNRRKRLLAAGPVTIFDSSSALATTSSADRIAARRDGHRRTRRPVGRRRQRFRSLAGGGGDGSGGRRVLRHRRRGRHVRLRRRHVGQHERERQIRAGPRGAAPLDRAPRPKISATTSSSTTTAGIRWLPTSRSSRRQSKSIARGAGSDRVWPGGGTYPLEALLHALSLEPDAIYFLSDGRFDPAVIEALRDAESILERPDPDPHDRVREPGDDRHHADDRQELGREVPVRGVRLVRSCRGVAGNLGNHEFWSNWNCGSRCANTIHRSKNRRVLSHPARGNPMIHGVCRKAVPQNSSNLRLIESCPECSKNRDEDLPRRHDEGSCGFIRNAAYVRIIGLWFFAC